MTRIKNLRRLVAFSLIFFSILVVQTSTFTPCSKRKIRVGHLFSSKEADQATRTKSSSAGTRDVGERRREHGADDISSRNQPKKQRKPWRANFHVSKKTQQKIQQAAVDRHGTRRSNIRRASAVLNALLNTAPEKCNAANLVCALTLSAKMLGTYSRPDAKFRSLLFRALEILNKLVKEESLHSRQLCNSIWAVAKHYDRDPEILPAVPQNLAIANGQAVETWDLSEEDKEDKSPEKMLDSTVENIARQLSSILRKEAEECQSNANANKKSTNRETKLGEICMAAWAFGMLRPRQRPPGWLQPPQLDKIEKPQKLDEPQPSQGKNNKNNFMSFEQWTLNEDDLSFLKPTGASSISDDEEDSEPVDATDEAFDAFAEALCRPIAGEMLTESSMYEPQFHLMRLTECTWSEVANVAWAFEKRGRCLSDESEMLLRALSREAAWRLTRGRSETRNMLSRDIAQLIWALGTLQQDNFRLAHDLVALVGDFSTFMSLQDRDSHSRPFQQWSCADIVQVISSLSHARIDDSNVLLALFEEAQSRLRDNGISAEHQRQDGRKVFLGWEVCVILWAQARLHLTTSEGSVYGEFPQQAASCLLDAAKECGLGKIGIGQQEQANLAWSLTVLQQHQSDEAIQLLQDVFEDAAKTTEEEGLIQLEHAHQLWQALFLLEEESPSAVRDVPQWFRDYLCDKWNLEKSHKKISSARHKSISDVLNLMGVAHVNEHDEDIDVAIVLKSQASWAHETGEGIDSMKIAVEFDGPNHFTRQSIAGDNPAATKPVRALGHTVLKYRLLKRKGWTVIRVPYYEFDKIPFWASMERQRYLQRLLKTHANIKFSTVDVSEYRSMTPNRKSRFD